MEERWESGSKTCKGAEWELYSCGLLQTEKLLTVANVAWKSIFSLLFPSVSVVSKAEKQKCTVNLAVLRAGIQGTEGVVCQRKERGTWVEC